MYFSFTAYHVSAAIVRLCEGTQLALDIVVDDNGLSAAVRHPIHRDEYLAIAKYQSVQYDGKIRHGMFSVDDIGVRSHYGTGRGGLPALLRNYCLEPHEIDKLIPWLLGGGQRPYFETRAIAGPKPALPKAELLRIEDDSGPVPPEAWDEAWDTKGPLIEGGEQ